MSRLLFVVVICCCHNAQAEPDRETIERTNAFVALCEENDYVGVVETDGGLIEDQTEEGVYSVLFLKSVTPILKKENIEDGSKLCVKVKLKFEKVPKKKLWLAGKKSPENSFGCSLINSDLLDDVERAKANLRKIQGDDYVEFGMGKVGKEDNDCKITLPSKKELPLGLG